MPIIYSYKIQKAASSRLKRPVIKIQSVKTSQLRRAVMGRKIPGKKHHGVKDPEKQQKARLDKVKMKVSLY